MNLKALLGDKFTEELSVEDLLKLANDIEYVDPTSVVAKDVYDRLKLANDKNSHDASEWKKKYNSTLTEQEQAKIASEQASAELQAKYDALLKETNVMKYTNQFLASGMDEKLRETVLEPFVKGLQEDGLDFRGVIFIGLMIENNEAKVLEFNVRFGDPETQSILLRLDSDLYEIMNAVALSKLDEVEVKWKDEQVTCVVLSSGGYPGSYEKSLPITGLDQLPDDIIVFHAGTAMKDGVLVTNGGRVLNVCAVGKHLDETREKVYQAIEKIHFDGMYCRKDIGLH